MTETVIRNITTEDLQECASVFYQVFGPQGCGEQWTVETCKARLMETTVKKEFCFVAINDEKIIGMIIALPEMREQDRDIFVDTFCVLSSYQGQHVGSNLMRTLEKACKQQGYKNIRLMGNPTFVSFNWYKNYGFHESKWVELEKPID